MDTLLENIRYAGRRLAQTPGFTSVAILSLALGIGANTAIFSLVNAVLIREAPLDKPEELVEVYLSTPDFEYNVFSWPDYEDFKEGTTEVFSEVSGTRLLIVQFDNAEGVEMVPGEAVTGNYFRTLGIEAELGRLLLPEDDIAPGGHAVVVLGHGYWQNAYGGDPGVVGQSLRIGGLAYTIVGVAPEAYSGHFRGVVPSVFAPRMMVGQLMPGATDELQARGNHSVFVKARKRPGVSLVQAETAASAVAARLRDDDVENWDSQASFLFVPTTDVILFPPADTFIKATAWILTGVVGLVLLLACINLASFLLARALDRKKEIALRLALGATRRHLIGQLLTETTMLALLGGTAGIAVSVGLLRILVSADLPLPLPITLDLSPDLTVLGFSLAVSVLAGLFLGLAPALQSTNLDMSATIKDESAGVGRSGVFTLRNILVVAQVATSLVLLVGAGLFLRSLQRVQTVDPGFGRDPAAILTLIVPSTRYSEDEGRLFTQRMLTRFRELPGVEAVGVTGNLHLNMMNTQNMLINVDGVEPPPERESHMVDRTTVGPGFFDAVGVRILRGRNFNEGDLADSPQSAIVNQALADKFFVGRDALGGILRRPDSEDLLIVGIASNAKIRSLGEAPRAFVYRPYSQVYTAFVTVVAKTRNDPQKTALDLMAAARELDSELMIWEAKTMDRHLGIVLLPARLSAVLFSAFAVVALALASIGLYGIVSFSVSQRTREIGIRMSLGANSGNVVRILMSSGLKLVAVGGVIGIVAAILIAPLLGSILFGVQGRDIAAFTAMPLILFAVAALAAFVPALRASRIDPVRALHTE
ncbi:MAG: ABC transporter permease [Acidobacteria bacterium]|nr:MAG: ABC transporter permease [Acidobacteriota bacterium]